MKKYILTLAVLTVLSMGTMSAQTHTSIHLGGAFPMGSFGSSNYDKGKWGLINDSDNGGAGLGFDIGLKMKFDIPSVSGLGIIATADFLFNGLNSDIKDGLEDRINEYEEEGYDVEITKPKYLNIPIMLGANYEYPLSSSVSVYAEAALGLNIRIITDMVLDFEEGDAVTTCDYDAATSFAYQIGAGFMFNNSISLGVNYYALGAARVKGEITEEFDRISNSEKFKFKNISPSMLLVRVGFHF